MKFHYPIYTPLNKPNYTILKIIFVGSKLYIFMRRSIDVRKLFKEQQNYKLQRFLEIHSTNFMSCKINSENQIKRKQY